MGEQKKKRKTRDLKMVKPGPSDVTLFLSTGSTILDLNISGLVDPEGRGGIPVGRFTEIFGPESSGKSYTSGELLGSAQAQNWDGHLADIERSFEFERAVIFNLDCRRQGFYYYPEKEDEEIDTVEDVIGVWKFGTAKKPTLGLINRVAEDRDPSVPGVMIVDSIAALSTKMEMQGDDKRGQDRAKKFSQAFRQTTGLIANKKLAVVFDNQVRDVEGYRGTDSPGGWAVKHYSSVRIRFGKPRRIKDQNGRIVGVYIDFEIVKNKIDHPYRTGTFTLLFDYGIDDIRDCAEWLKDNTNLLGESKSWYQIEGRKKVQGLNNFVKYVEDNDLEEWLVSTMRKEWIEMHKNFEPRKKRVRV